MRGKPVLVEACRQVALGAIGGHYEPATILLHRVAAWEGNGELGGVEASAVVRALGELKRDMGLERLPDRDLEADLWCAITF